MNYSVENLKEQKEKKFKSIFLLSTDHFDVFNSNIFSCRTYITNMHLSYFTSNFNTILRSYFKLLFPYLLQLEHFPLIKYGF